MPEAITKERAQSTLEFAILDALAASADRTGLRAGDAAVDLSKEIAKSILDSRTRWALLVLLGDARPFDPVEFGFAPDDPPACEASRYHWDRAWSREGWRVVYCAHCLPELCEILECHGDDEDVRYRGHWPNSAASARVILQHLGVEVE